MVKDSSLNAEKLYEVMEHDPQDATTPTSLSSSYSSVATTRLDHKQLSKLLARISTCSVETNPLKQNKRRILTAALASRPLESFLQHISMTVITSNYFQHESWNINSQKIITKPIHNA